MHKISNRALVEGVYRLAIAMVTVAHREAQGQVAHWKFLESPYGKPDSVTGFTTRKEIIADAQEFIEEWQQHIISR